MCLAISTARSSLSRPRASRRQWGFTDFSAIVLLPASRPSVKAHFSCSPSHGQLRSLPSGIQGQPGAFIKSRTLSKTRRSVFGFAFDVDGVLLRESEPLPGASLALQVLHRNKVPYILLTNGGGKHESERVAQLSRKLRVPLTEENFVQSHTPFKQLVEGNDSYPALKDKNILVTGGKGDKVRQVAEMYGFNNVVTPADIMIAHPNIWPFNQIFPEYYESTHRPIPQSPSLKIDAIFVFNDPRDWALDIQIIVDLLLSEQGVLGTYSNKNGDLSLPNSGWQQDGQPSLFFSNPDLFWAANYHLPRFGQGAFQAALLGVWNTVTSGAKLSRTTIGKPYTETYDYAELVLNNHRAQINPSANKDSPALQTVYMVGDNPESDIRGANEFKSPAGASWKSMLVKTGVFDPRNGPPKYEPTHIADDVREAVAEALRIELEKSPNSRATQSAVKEISEIY